MSEAKIGENNYNLGKSLSAGTKALISAAISIVKNIPPPIYVYRSDGVTFMNTFYSATKAGGGIL